MLFQREKSAVCLMSMVSLRNRQFIRNLSAQVGIRNYKEISKLSKCKLLCRSQTLKPEECLFNPSCQGAMLSIRTTEIALAQNSLVEMLRDCKYLCIYRIRKARA